MTLSLRQRLVGFVTIIMIPILSGCVETMEGVGRDGFQPARGVITDGLDQTPTSAIGAWAQSPVMMKILVMALAMALMVSIIIGTTLYYKAESQKN